MKQPDALFLRRRSLEAQAGAVVIGGLYPLSGPYDMASKLFKGIAYQVLDMAHADSSLGAIWVDPNDANDVFDKKLFRKRLDASSVIVMGFVVDPDNPDHHKVSIWDDLTDPEIAREVAIQRGILRKTSFAGFRMVTMEKPLDLRENEDGNRRAFGLSRL